MSSNSHDWVWETKDGKVVALQVEYDDDWFARWAFTPAKRKQLEKENKREIAKFCADAIRNDCIPKRLPHVEACELLRKSL